MLDAGCWSERSGDPENSGILDAGQIVDDLAPISRLEGDIFYRGCWIRDTRYMMSAPEGWPQTSPVRHASGRARKCRVVENTLRILSAVGTT